MKICAAVGVVVTPEAQATHDLHSFYQKHGFQVSARTLLYADLTQPHQPQPAENNDKHND